MFMSHQKVLSTTTDDQFHKKEWDVTDCFTQLFCLGTAKMTFVLDEERMSLNQSNCCESNTQSVVYGDVGDIGD
jgi:hypothetical protein